MLIFAESGEFPARSSIDGEEMRHEEFKIGTRVIVAIQIEPGNDPSWCNGPPYAVAEFVFDEDDIVACKKCVYCRVSISA